MRILAIESSCDETSAAVIEDGRDVRGLVISSQIDIHRKYGGVVPEIASRKHLEAICPVIDGALEQAACNFRDLDLIAVTQGPGLVGALLVGISAAKSLSLALGIPIVAVNHMAGHIAANYIEHRDLKPPFLSLVVSGGHTYLVEVRSYTDYLVRGRTKDDAIGEAYDKVARHMGLPYPGGPEMDRIAKLGMPSISFPRVLQKEDSYDFSFSGLKTAVINYLNGFEQKKLLYSKEDVAASFQEAAMDVLVEKCFRLQEGTGYDTVAIAGGVAANTRLRHRMEETGKKKGVRIVYPSPIYCTDNAAMIGVSGYYSYLENGASGLEFRAVPNLGL